MRATFKTVFYVNASKEKNGVVPIMGRVTINGTIAQFSCKQTIQRTLWDAKGNRAKGKSKEAQAVNAALDNIKVQIAKHYQRISDRETYVTAEMVRNAYQGIGTEYETLLRAFDKENGAFAKRVGKDRSKRTYRKYLTVRKYVAEFIKAQYRRSDISMNELTEDFLRDFCLYLRNEVGLAQSSVWIYSIPLKHIVTTAHYNGKIPRNPFAQYHVDPDFKEREYLTEEELRAFASVELDSSVHTQARDLFMFGALTGISFIDIKNLTTENIVEMKDNVKRERLKEPDRTKYELYDILQTEIGRCGNWNVLAANLKRQGVEVHFKHKGHTDEIQGVVFTKNGYHFNGSKVDRRFSYSKINAALQRNRREEYMELESMAKHHVSEMPNVPPPSATGHGEFFSGSLGLLNGSSSYNAADAEANQEMADILRRKKKAKRKRGMRL